MNVTINATVLRDGSKVAFLLDGQRLFDMTVGVADAVCRALRAAADEPGEQRVKYGGKVLSFRREIVDAVEVVVFIGAGRMLFAAPLEAAAQIRSAITAQARLIEEEQQAERIIRDQSILAISGAPFGLSNNPKILAEAAKEAHWGAIRRYRRPERPFRLLGAPRIINGSRSALEALSTARPDVQSEVRRLIQRSMS